MVGAERPRSRWAATSSSSISARIGSSSSARSRSPRATCGSRRRSGGTGRAPRASRRSRRAPGPAPPAPTTRQSSAKPVPRAAITSLWSPKIESAWVATRARGDVEDRRRQLAGDLEHVREHQQQALRRGERRRQRAGLERAVDRAGGASLALHLDHLGHRAPDVRAPAAAPGVGELAHRRGRGDRVDRDHLARAVGDARRRLVAVNDLSRHYEHRRRTRPAGHR